MLDAAGYLDIDADGIREMPAPPEEEEGVEAETIEELKTAISNLSASLTSTRSQVTSLESEIAALGNRLNSSLNIAYGLAVVALIAAAVAAYYAMKR